MPPVVNPVSDLARIYRQRIPTQTGQPAARSDRFGFGMATRPTGQTSSNPLGAVGRFMKTAVASLDPRFILSEGGRSVEHVVGDVTELGRSVVTGRDTLSQSPSARAYQAAGGGAPGVFAAAMPYVNVATALIPEARLLTPAGRVASGADALERGISNAILRSADERIAGLQEAQNIAVQKAKDAVTAQNPDAYNRAVIEYINKVKLGYTKPEYIVGGTAYGQSPSAAALGEARAANEIARAATTNSPRLVQLGIKPDKALTMIEDGSPYGPMFNPERNAQIAGEREAYTAKFINPARRRLMESAGIDTSKLTDYELDRLVAENEVLGIPYGAPISERPIYAAVPRPNIHTGLSDYAGSPASDRFTVQATFDATGRPVTVSTGDSFPSVALGDRPYPADLADKIGSTYKYQEMQVGGGPLPLDKLRDLTVAYEYPETMRYTDPQQFYSYLDRFYPDRTGYTFMNDRLNAEMRLPYLRQQLALVKAAQDKNIPVTVLQARGLNPDVAEAISQGRRLAEPTRPRGFSADYQHLFEETNVAPTYSSMADATSQVSDLESAISAYDNYLNWAKQNQRTIEDRAQLLNALKHKSDLGRLRAEQRATEAAARATARQGVTADSVSQAVKVLPYPANDPKETTRFLEAAYANDVDKATEIWLDISDRWKRELASGNVPSTENYFMYTDTEGLLNLIRNGNVPQNTIMQVIERIQAMKPSPVIDESADEFAFGL